jgi:hypothetical protein
MHMSLKALITTLVLGSSSVALAAPVVRDHRTHEPAPTRISSGSVDHRSSIDIYATADISVRPRPTPMPPAPAPMPPQLSWVLLANDAKVAGRTTIKIAQGTRAFTKLELRAQGNGNAQIEKVLITFGNGQTQTVNVHKRLSKYDSSFSIDLTGNTRFISKVVLVGKGNAGRRGASVDVLAI